MVTTIIPWEWGKSTVIPWGWQKRYRITAVTVIIDDRITAATVS